MNTDDSSWPPAPTQSRPMPTLPGRGHRLARLVVWLKWLEIALFALHAVALFLWPYIGLALSMAFGISLTPRSPTFLRLGWTTAFLAWEFVLYNNLTALGCQEIPTSPYRAIGSWFVPLVNLVLPHDRIQDIWRAGDPAADNGDIKSWGMAPNSRLVTAWWISYILIGIAAMIGTLWALSSSVATLAVAFLVIITTLLTIAMVNAVSNRQIAKLRRLDAPDAPATAETH